eukprot:jgi/Bigna1/143775/aug1.81_g18483
MGLKNGQFTLQAVSLFSQASAIQEKTRNPIKSLSAEKSIETLAAEASISNDKANLKKEMGSNEVNNMESGAGNIQHQILELLATHGKERKTHHNPENAAVPEGGDKHGNLAEEKDGRDDFTLIAHELRHILLEKSEKLILKALHRDVNTINQLFEHIIECDSEFSEFLKTTFRTVTSSLHEDLLHHRDSVRDATGACNFYADCSHNLQALHAANHSICCEARRKSVSVVPCPQSGILQSCNYNTEEGSHCKYQAMEKMRQMASVFRKDYEAYKSKMAQDEKICFTNYRLAAGSVERANFERAKILNKFTYISQETKSKFHVYSICRDISERRYTNFVALSKAKTNKRIKEWDFNEVLRCMLENYIKEDASPECKKVPMPPLTLKGQIPARMAAPVLPPIQLVEIRSPDSLLDSLGISSKFYSSNEEC